MDHTALTSLIHDLLIVLAAGLLAGTISKRLGLSVLVGYLLIGGVIGSGGLGLVAAENNQLETLAEIGVLLLLFAIGVEFSLEELLRLGRSFLIGGSVEMLLVGLPLGAAAAVFGAPWQAALLIGAATAFSSTVLVFKALEEWGQTASPHGRRGIGILLFQDAMLVPLMLLMPLLAGDVPGDPSAAFAVLALKTLAVLGLVPAARIVVQRWVAPFLSRQRSVELVVLFAVIVVSAGTFVALLLGLPPILGAFAAGLVLNGNRLTKQIDALVLPFRETFAAVFFVSLGAFIRFDTLLDAPLATVGTLVGVLLVKTLASAVALRLTGLRWPAAVGMGLGLAQVGEFAFVLLSVGLAEEVIQPLTYNVIVFVAVGTLVLTPQLLKVGLRWAQRAPVAEHEIAIRPTAPGDDIPRALVAGIGPLGAEVASQLETKGYDACLIDFSPVNLHPFAQQGFRTLAGDASDGDLLRRADAPHCRLAVVAVPDDAQARRIVSAIRQLNASCPLLVRCRYGASQQELRKLGATAVLSEEAELSRPLLALVEKHA